MKLIQFSKIIIIFFTVCSIVNIYLKFLLYDSYVLQKTFIIDINSNSWDKDSLFINEINDYFPTLTNTTVPIKTIKGKYIYSTLDELKGIDYMKKGIKDNPYLMFSEGNIADAYIRRDKDSFYYYTKKAFKNLPNNPVNYVLFSNILKNENKIDSIIYFFDIISKRVNDEQIYRIALASLIGEKDSLLISRGIEIANEAINKYPSRKELFNVFKDKLTYGESNYDLAIDLNESAITLSSNGDLKSAIALFKAALLNQSNNPIYFNNVIQSYSLIEDYKGLIDFYDNNFKKIDNIFLKTKYYYYESLYKTSDYERACKMIDMIDSNMQMEITKNLYLKC